MSIFTRTPPRKDALTVLADAHAAQRLERDEADRAMRYEIERLLEQRADLMIENRRLRATANALRGMA